MKPSDGRAIATRDVHAAFVVGTTALYLGFVLVGVARHEMWRDELQAWMISANSSSLFDVFANKRYEGQGAVWYIALYIISRFTNQPLFMQLFHIAIATTTVSLVLRYCPLPKYQRVLFVFGYYLIYEYAVISRHYTLGILLVAVFCVLGRSGATHPVYQVIVLALLIQTSMYGVLLASALLVLPGASLLRQARVKGGLPSTAFCTLLIATSLALAAFGMMAPKDSGYGGWSFDLSPVSIRRTVNIVWSAFAPIPQLNLHFWNSNIVGSKAVQLPLAVTMLVVSMILLAPWRQLMFVYGAGASMLLVFSHVKYHGLVRHHGHLFVLFMACLWLAHSRPRTDDPTGSSGRRMGLTSLMHGSSNRIITALLSMQVMAGVYASAMDWVYPFSASKRVAEFLKAPRFADAQIAGYPDPSASAVAGYLGREIYYLASDRHGTFVVYDLKGHRKSFTEVIDSAHRIATVPNRETVLILDPWEPRFDPGEQDELVLLGSFTESIEPSESFNVYLLKR